MLDTLPIEKCADPSLKPSIVEQFVEAAGSRDPLAVTVKSGDRIILVPRAKTADKAMDIIRQYAGYAVVRVGITQVPAGIGVRDASGIKPELVDSCANLRVGTKMFAKVLRIVAKWYGSPKSEEVFSRIFEDAVYAWKTGEFEGTAVFQAPDPGEARHRDLATVDGVEVRHEMIPTADTPEHPDEGTDVRQAGIRIDLLRIGGAN